MLSYPSWLGEIRVDGDVSNSVSDEAVETVKAIGAEARNVAEAASLKARSWVVIVGGPIRSAVYLSGLLLGTFAFWLLVATLRKCWPTWPSPHAQAVKDEQPAAGYTGSKEGENFSLEIRRRGEAVRQAALKHLGERENLPAGTTRRSGQNPRPGASPTWSAELPRWSSEVKAGSLVLWFLRAKRKPSFGSPDADARLCQSAPLARRWIGRT